MNVFSVIAFGLRGATLGDVIWANAFGAGLAATTVAIVTTRITLAGPLAVWRGDRGPLVAALEAQRAEHARSRPALPG